MRILFVCTGNMCRSPMAEGLARAVVDRRYPEKRERFYFSSAGVAALVGNAPTREAVEVMMERGIDISSHRAVGVTRSFVEASDLVLTLEDAQSKFVSGTAGGAGLPVFLLLELGEAAGKLPAAPDGVRGGTDRLSELLRIAGEGERDDPLIRKKSRLEVPDPIGMPVEEYRHVAAIMEGPIENILRALTW